MAKKVKVKVKGTGGDGSPSHAPLGLDLFLQFLQAEEEEEEAGPTAPHDVSSISLLTASLEPLDSGCLLFGVFSFLGSTVDTVPA